MTAMGEGTLTTMEDRIHTTATIVVVKAVMEMDTMHQGITDTMVDGRIDFFLMCIPEVYDGILKLILCIIMNSSGKKIEKDRML